MRISIIVTMAAALTTVAGTATAQQVLLALVAPVVLTILLAPLTLILYRRK